MSHSHLPPPIMLSWGLADPTFHSAEEHGVTFGDSSEKDQELNSVILVASVQLGMFCDSVN